MKVVAGWGHSAALTKDGQLFVCGRNFQGQLGLGSPQRFPQNERGHPFQAAFCLIDRLSHLKIRQIACGGEHSVAVADNGEVGLLNQPSSVTYDNLGFAFFVFVFVFAIGTGVVKKRGRMYCKQYEECNVKYETKRKEAGGGEYGMGAEIY